DMSYFFFQAEDGIRDRNVTGVQTCALPIFRSRIREEAGLSTLGLSELRLAILIRLRDTGPSTAAALAEAEHVSQQAIAQCLNALKSENLVSASTDPNDRRKVLTSLSANGGELPNSIRTSRDTWLNRAIDAAVAPTEQ